jgi:hypothetical protein
MSPSGKAPGGLETTRNFLIFALIDSKKSCKFIHVMLKSGELGLTPKRVLGFPEES